MTQAKLAKLLQVHPTAVSKYETYTVPLTDDLIVKLCKIFDVTSDYLLGVPINISGKYPIAHQDRNESNNTDCPLNQTAPYKAELISRSIRNRMNEGLQSLNISLVTLAMQLEHMVINLSEQGVDEEIISKATGISIDDIHIILYKGKKR